MSAILITKKQLAEALGVSDRTIQNWLRQGLVPSVRIGRRTVRFCPNEVITYLKRRGSR